jgi:hypothetical protein
MAANLPVLLKWWCAAACCSASVLPAQLHHELTSCRDTRLVRGGVSSLRPSSGVKMSSAPSIKAQGTVVGAVGSLPSLGSVWLLDKGLRVPALKHVQDGLWDVGSLSLFKEERRIKHHACWTVQISLYGTLYGGGSLCSGLLRRLAGLLMLWSPTYFDWVNPKAESAMMYLAVTTV